MKHFLEQISSLQRLISKIINLNIKLIYVYLFAFLFSCTNEYESKIIGSYSVSAYDLDNNSNITVDSPVLVLNSNKKFSLKYNQKEICGNWKAEDSGDFSLLSLTTNSIWNTNNKNYEEGFIYIYMDEKIELNFSKPHTRFFPAFSSITFLKK